MVHVCVAEALVETADANPPVPGPRPPRAKFSRRMLQPYRQWLQVGRGQRWICLSTFQPQDFAFEEALLPIAAQQKWHRRLPQSKLLQLLFFREDFLVAFEAEGTRRA